MYVTIYFFTISGNFSYIHLLHINMINHLSLDLNIPGLGTSWGLDTAE